MAFPNARAAVAALAARSATLEDLREIVTAFPELRPVVAAYPDTDEGLLSWLRELQDPAVDAQLAKRTPPVVPVPPVGAAQTPLLERTAPTLVTGFPGPVESARFLPAASAQSAGDAATWRRSALPQTVDPVHTPTTQTEPRKRRLWPVILAVVAALVVVGGGLGAAYATGLIGGTPAQSPRPVNSASRAPSTGQATSVSTVASPTPATTTSATTTGFTCWDNTTVTSISACRLPLGEDAAWNYLKYVYPSVASHPDCAKDEYVGTAYTGFTVMWECELGDSMIRYRYWEKVSDAEKHYTKKFDANTTLKTYDILIGGEPAEGWAKTDMDSATGPGGVKRRVMTMWLPTEHLSLSVEGNTTKAMWAAFNQVTTRSPAQSLGHSSGEAPAEAPITAQAR